MKLKHIFVIGLCFSAGVITQNIYAKTDKHKSVKPQIELHQIDVKYGYIYRLNDLKDGTFILNNAQEKEFSKKLSLYHYASLNEGVSTTNKKVFLFDNSKRNIKSGDKITVSKAHNKVTTEIEQTLPEEDEVQDDNLISEHIHISKDLGPEQILVHVFSTDNKTYILQEAVK